MIRVEDSCRYEITANRISRNSRVGKDINTPIEANDIGKITTGFGRGDVGGANGLHVEG